MSMALRTDPVDSRYCAFMSDVGSGRHRTSLVHATIRDTVRGFFMCRNIKTLFNFEPPASDDEIRAAALQFVRKLSGFNAPSKINEAAFNRAIEEVSDSARKLLGSLTTLAPPRDRDIEAEKAKERSRLRFGQVES